MLYRKGANRYITTPQNDKWYPAKGLIGIPSQQNDKWYPAKGLIGISPHRKTISGILQPSESVYHHIVKR
nr:hypothetical protein [Fredinandcohnia onubensis]